MIENIIFNFYCFAEDEGLAQLDTVVSNTAYTKY